MKVILKKYKDHDLFEVLIENHEKYADFYHELYRDWLIENLESEEYRTNE